jgi:hypothetical protein
MKPTPIEPRTSLECWRARRVVGVASCARATSGLARDQGEPSAPRSVLVQALPSCRDLLGCLLKRTPSLHRHCLTFQVLVDREEPPPWACGESRWARVMLGAVGGGAERWRWRGARRGRPGCACRAGARTVSPRAPKASARDAWRTRSSRLPMPARRAGGRQRSSHSLLGSAPVRVGGTTTRRGGALRPCSRRDNKRLVTLQRAAAPDAPLVVVVADAALANAFGQTVSTPGGGPPFVLR